jgi:acyl carrier protein
MEKIFEEIKQILASKLDITEEDIKLESSFKEDLGADSLDVVDLTMDIEDTFNIDIGDEDFEKILTVNDLVNYIKAKTQVGSQE